MPVQYWHFIKGIFVGARLQATARDAVTARPPCFGYSFTTSTAGLAGRCIDRLPVTALAGARRRGALAASSASPIGVLSALQAGLDLRPHRRWASRWPASRCRSSSPACSRWRCSSYKLDHLRQVGSYVAVHRQPGEWASNLILPWITLAFLYAALYARLTRAGMLETMSEDYIRTARAKGLPERTVVVKHGLRAALTPILTIFGLDLGLLLGGAVLTETVFSLPGHRASSRIDAISSNDLPMILGVTPGRGVLHRDRPTWSWTSCTPSIDPRVRLVA